MRAPYGLNILDNCTTCPLKDEHLFCNLSVQASQRLNEIKSTAVYPKGAMLFIEGQLSRGRALQWEGEAVDDVGKAKRSARRSRTPGMSWD